MSTTFELDFIRPETDWIGGSDEIGRPIDWKPERGDGSSAG